MFYGLVFLFCLSDCQGTQWGPSTAESEFLNEMWMNPFLSNSLKMVLAYVYYILYYIL